MKKRHIGLMLVACMIATSAQAQRTGSRLGTNAKSTDANAVLENIARCAGQRKPGYATEILGLMPGSKAESDKIFGNKGDLGMCMEDQTGRLVIPDNVELSMSARSFRTELARVMAKAAIAKIDPPALADAQAWNLELYKSDPAAAARVDRFQLALYQFGDCVIAAKPAEAAEIVLSGAGSAKGKAAMKVLSPVMGPCLPQGVELKLTGDLLAVALAEPAYYRAVALNAGNLANKGS